MATIDRKSSSVQVAFHVTSGLFEYFACQGKIA
jgi:hypothetical protein